MKSIGWSRALLLLATACLDPGVPTLVTGDWGGPHLGLVATISGATLEYDCAEGRIAGPIRPDDGGRFLVTGEHFPGHGGPIRIGDPVERLPASYLGTVRGNTMTVTVTLTDSNQTLGTFTLVRGASPHVFKCL